MNRRFENRGLEMKLVTFVLAILVAFASTPHQAQNSPPGTPAAPAGNAENGKKLFVAVGCWTCHGYSGQGAAAPRLAPDPIPLTAFIRYVRSPSDEMPPYTAKVLKDSELTDMYAFLRTIPKAPDPANIPLLRSVN
jgi:mono/diheme cytochrome c family protein